MLWKFAKCPGNLENVLEEPQVLWIFFGNGKGAPKCLEFTSEHLEKPKLQGPTKDPPAFSVESQFSSFSPKSTYIPGILQKTK